MRKRLYKTIFVRLVFGLAALALSGKASEGQGPAEDSYTQQLTIRFRDASAAQRAVVKIEPLYDGHHRAVSCRWDDNWTSDNLKTRDVMEEYGIRGTWYLNDREFSPENRPADYLPVAIELLRGGNSIGGHSLTHPFITYFHSHRMFAEMSGVRIAWEAALDKPVVSYAYSFVDLCPQPEGRQVLHRTLESLSRAGFYHVAEYVSFFDGVEMQHELSPIMPPENNPLDAFRSAVQWAYDDVGMTNHHPMITNSMHAWYGTQRLEYGYNELRKRFDLLTALPDVWHCNQNQYAAYRRQFRYATLTQAQRSAATLNFTLTRPSVIALNDDTPLTLSVSGVDPETVVSVDCRCARVVMSDRKLVDRRLFHLEHAQRENLPVKIGHISNHDNDSAWRGLKRDIDFPQIQGGIYVEEETLKLALECEGDQMLEAVRAQWHVPIGYRIDAPVQRPAESGLGRWSLSQPLIPSPDHDSRWGTEHFAAQIDFRLAGQPGRIHLTCQRPGAMPDDSLPREGFAVLGPISNHEFDTDAFIRWVRDNPNADQWKHADGSVLRWRKGARDGYIHHQWLNPEYVRTMGTWDAESPTYALRSSVYCPEQRRVQILTSHAALRTTLVNGQIIESDNVDLRRGENQIVIIYPGCRLGVETQRLAACFVRLLDPSTGQRFHDIRYRAY